jgi:hypothetical protein
VFLFVAFVATTFGTTTEKRPGLDELLNRNETPLPPTTCGDLLTSPKRVLVNLLFLGNIFIQQDVSVQFGVAYLTGAARMRFYSF